jgi:hypothetical protein
VITPEEKTAAYR